VARAVAESELPSALDQFAEIERRLQGPGFAVFLDYDGTLTPIAARPELAVLGTEARDAVARLAEVVPVAVVTGRALKDVRERVGLEGIYYAGNHGFEIEGPGVRHHRAPELRQTFDELAARLSATAANTPGCTLEAKGYSVAVHYRGCEPAAVAALRTAVEAAVEGHDEVRLGHGKKVFELRPTLPWNKGEAVRWLIEDLGRRGPAPKPVFVGDDRTDEDALVVVRDQGVGVFVGTPGWDTAALYGVKDTQEVTILLTRLTEFARQA
jgi:alpha,alpha-trehalase